MRIKAGLHWQHMFEVEAADHVVAVLMHPAGIAGCGVEHDAAGVPDDQGAGSGIGWFPA